MSLANLKITHDLARALKAADQIKTNSIMPKGAVVRGTIVDVNDAEERGRVRVIFDAMNAKDIPQIEGAGYFSGEREGDSSNYSHWVDVAPAFVGKQPAGLIGKRVNIVLSNGQYPYAVLNDVVYDPQNLVKDAASQLEQPNNSPMTRLPCYPSSELPPATKENVGCIIVELGGPQGDDWLMVCLKRMGGYMWVRHIDRLHYHTGQLPDSDGDIELRTFDDTIETTASPLEGFDYVNQAAGNL